MVDTPLHQFQDPRKVLLLNGLPALVDNLGLRLSETHVSCLVNELADALPRVAQDFCVLVLLLSFCQQVPILCHDLSIGNTELFHAPH